jgi:hypothetical protein
MFQMATAFVQIITIKFDSEDTNKQEPIKSATNNWKQIV